MVRAQSPKAATRIRERGTFRSYHLVEVAMVATLLFSQETTTGTDVPSDVPPASQ